MLAEHHCQTACGCYYLAVCQYVTAGGCAPRFCRTGLLGCCGQPHKPADRQWSSSCAECCAAGRQVCQQHRCGQPMAHCWACTGGAARCVSAQPTPVCNGAPFAAQRLWLDFYSYKWCHRATMPRPQFQVYRGAPLVTGPGHEHVATTACAPSSGLVAAWQRGRGVCHDRHRRRDAPDALRAVHDGVEVHWRAVAELPGAPCSAPQRAYVC